MWDDPLALRRLSNWLFAAVFALLAFGVVHITLHLPLFALRTVQFDAQPQRVDVDQLATVVHNELRGNFFTIDLERTRQEFARLPWVRRVSVRRHFPWQLDVSLEEQVALARWNGTQLLNTHGEVFTSETAQQLPDLSGPAGSAAEVAQRYQRFSEQLVPLGQHVARLSLSSRGAWQLKLQDGMVLELGREQMERRLARFVAVYPYSVATLGKAVSYVDLRYRNGFAASLAAGHGRA